MATKVISFLSALFLFFVFFFSVNESVKFAQNAPNIHETNFKLENVAATVSATGDGVTKTKINCAQYSEGTPQEKLAKSFCFLKFYLDNAALNPDTKLAKNLKTAENEVVRLDSSSSMKDLLYAKYNLLKAQEYLTQMQSKNTYGQKIGPLYNSISFMDRALKKIARSSQSTSTPCSVEYKVLNDFEYLISSYLAPELTPLYSQLETLSEEKKISAKEKYYTEKMLDDVSQNLGALSGDGEFKRTITFTTILKHPLLTKTVQSKLYSLWKVKKQVTDNLKNRRDQNKCTLELAQEQRKTEIVSGACESKQACLTTFQGGGCYSYCCKSRAPEGSRQAAQFVPPSWCEQLTPSDAKSQTLEDKCRNLAFRNANRAQCESLCPNDMLPWCISKSPTSDNGFLNDESKWSPKSWYEKFFGSKDNTPENEKTVSDNDSERKDNFPFKTGETEDPLATVQDSTSKAEEFAKDLPDSYDRETYIEKFKECEKKGTILASCDAIAKSYAKSQWQKKRQQIVENAERIASSLSGKYEKEKFIQTYTNCISEGTNSILCESIARNKALNQDTKEGLNILEAFGVNERFEQQQDQTQVSDEVQLKTKKWCSAITGKCTDSYDECSWLCFSKTETKTVTKKQALDYYLGKLSEYHDKETFEKAFGECTSKDINYCYSIASGKAYAKWKELKEQQQMQQALADTEHEFQKRYEAETYYNPEDFYKDDRSKQCENGDECDKFGYTAEPAPTPPHDNNQGAGEDKYRRFGFSYNDKEQLEKFKQDGYVYCGSGWFGKYCYKSQDACEKWAGKGECIDISQGVYYESANRFCPQGTQPKRYGRNYRCEQIGNTDTRQIGTKTTPAPTPDKTTTPNPTQTPPPSKCPPNSTLQGNTCVCDTGYVAFGKACVKQAGGNPANNTNTQNNSQLQGLIAKYRQALARQKAEFEKAWAQRQAELKKILEQQKKKYEEQLKKMQEQMQRLTQAQNQRPSQRITPPPFRPPQDGREKQHYPITCSLSLTKQEIKVDDTVAVKWSAEPVFAVKEATLSYYDDTHNKKTEQVSASGIKAITPKIAGNYAATLSAKSISGESCSEMIEFAVQPKEQTGDDTTKQSTNVQYFVHEVTPKIQQTWFAPRIPQEEQRDFARIYIAPNPIYQGEKAIINWQGTGNCKLFAPNFTKPLKGDGEISYESTDELVKPGSYTYKLVCGDASDAVVLVVLPKQETRSVSHSNRPLSAPLVETAYPQVTQQNITQNRCPVFTQYLKRGVVSEQVKTVEEFLKKFGYFSGVPDDTFDTQTEEAVKRFQAEHTEAILNPWGHSTPTGYWYKYTRWYANKLMGCLDPTFNPDLN